MNCPRDQMASSSSADGSVKGTPSWMVIPRVLVAVGSLLPLHVYLEEGKMSGFEEEQPRILAGFSVASPPDSSTSSSWKQAYVSHMKTCT